MKIRKGDIVYVIAGKNRGTTGKVIHAFPATARVVVEGVNVIKKHERPKKSRQKGQVVERAMPISVSNVAILDPKDKKPSRIGKKQVGTTFVRVSKRSGSQLDS